MKTPTDRRRPPSLDDAVASVLQLKKVLQGEPAKLDALYKTLIAFKNGEINTSAMISTVGEILCGHKDLVLSFNTFLPEGYKVQDYSLIIRQIEFVNTIHRRFGKDRKFYSSFVNIIEKHANDAVGAREKMSVLFRDFPEVIRAFESFLPEPPRVSNEDESECGPSYKRRKIELQSSQRRKMRVLNDSWVCDAPNAIWARRPAMDEHEKAVLDCEDERFELDMVIERCGLAMAHIDENEPLTAIDLRFIERLYGEHGLDIVDLVKKDPVRTLPIIRRRIYQKKVELTIFREKKNQQWAKVYKADNGSKTDMQCDS